MRTLRLLVVPVIASFALVAGCGAETSPDGGTDVDAGSGAETSDPTSAETSEAETSEPEPAATDPPGDKAIGAVVVSMPLAVEAGDYPGPPVPKFAEVADATELAAVFSAAPGVEEVVAELEASPPDPESRLFVYVVGACNVEDVSLDVKGGEVTMVVHGNSTIRCEPPPVQMVVFEVGPDEVPADAVPVQAVIK